MNIQPNRLVIAAVLAVAGGGAITYALHTSSHAQVAQVAPIAAPPPVADTPAIAPAPAPVAEAAAVPAPVAAPASVVQNDTNAGASETNPKVAPNEPKATSTRHARVRNGADTDAVAAVSPSAATTVDATASAGDQTIARNTTDAAQAPAAGPAGDAPTAAPTADTVNVDSKITTEVKSRLAADSVTKDADIGVNTTQGVVVLTGTVATQDAVDHLKSVAQNVPDVKSVDTSALKVTSTG
ncbi:MAG: BON domain-containing protein [Steroidobacteraceae bacterium]